MLDYQYTYLLFSLLSLAVWVTFWLRMPQSWRRPYLYLSLIMLPAGLSATYLWFLRDWWHPQTLFGTRVGIEDLLLSFTNGSIAAVIGMWLYRPERVDFHYRRILWPFAAIFGLTALFFYVFNWHSFYANTIAGLIVTTVIFIRFPRSVRSSLLTGVIIFVSVLPAYRLAQWLSPGWIEATWTWDRLSGITLWSVPLEDLLWYAAVGIGFSAMFIYANQNITNGYQKDKNQA